MTRSIALIHCIGCFQFGIVYGIARGSYRSLSSYDRGAAVCFLFIGIAFNLLGFWWQIRGAR